MDNQQDINFDLGLPIVDLPKTNNCIIKVIGVGGGGGNAVNHMYREGIHDVSYVVCNTDKKALEDSAVPNHLQLGCGLGAGNRPEKARKIAEESIDAIKEMLNDGTRMVFITAGMGGGTGTGAAPIIARCAKEAGILTVGIVTIPFRFEGIKKINQALDGVEEISKHVDALLVINNERLREIYPELTVINAFAKADDTLTIAAKSIAEIITMHGIMNLDFEDVTTVLKDGGVAIMSTGYGEGENRVTKAIKEALNSPLLNHNDIFNSKKVLLNINFCADDDHSSLMMEEMNEIHDFMGKFRHDVETKWGLATDSTLGSKVKITLLATGFGLQNISGMSTHQEEASIRVSEEDKELKEHREDLIGIYYSDGKNTTKRRHRNIFIYTPDNMDNDDIISRVDATPTCRRTKEDLNRLKSDCIG
ncbi:MAG: cell division protein FtsZ [Bacteroidaceae bacterium]|nr:cell division protein FtsZ [Bacteroidaceae bacterium]MEE1288770.1 cell division protein FtsZ [Bacteroidaceae bacterium]